MQRDNTVRVTGFAVIARFGELEVAVGHPILNFDWLPGEDYACRHGWDVDVAQRAPGHAVQIRYPKQGSTFGYLPGGLGIFGTGFLDDRAGEELAKALLYPPTPDTLSLLVNQRRVRPELVQYRRPLCYEWCDRHLGRRD